MKNTKHTLFILLITLTIWSCTNSSRTEQSEENTTLSNPGSLPSWNEGKTKTAILDFVKKTTTEGSPDFIPAADRIACFDNDGTLWSEQPMYFQLAFAIDRVKAMAPEHPEWSSTQPFKALLEDDLHTAMAGGEKAILQIVGTTHTGMTTEAFEKNVRDWIETAKHPKTGKLYKEMIYKPMVELLDYLRANGFKTFIVSGGGVDFMRPWVEQAYGIPPDQVVGSSGKVKYEVVEGIPVIHKLPDLNFIDDKEGKPVGIYQYIGKRPVFAAGNSDGDYAMLQWTTSAKGYPRFGMIVHHTDEVREWAYDRNSHIGQLVKGLDDAATHNWLIVDMKQDWNRIYSFE